MRQNPVENVLKHLPRAVRIGISKRGARRGRNPKVRKFAFEIKEVKEVRKD